MSIASSSKISNIDNESRKVVMRRGGKMNGPVKRVFSPSDLGQLLKPFVFLDRFDIPPSGGLFKIHPHSGIATVTVMLNGSVQYSDTIGNSGRIDAGGIEWMNAGGGAWHDTHPVGSENVMGYQLWLALPPELENAPATSQYLAPEEAVTLAPSSQLVLGQYGGLKSTIHAPDGINYLRINLQSGQRWRYETPTDHTVGWVFVHKGRLHVSGTTLEEEFAVFAESDDVLEFEAEGDTEFVLGSAVKHRHDLCLGYYSVHTSAAALERGEAEISRIGVQLGLIQSA